MIVFTCGGTGGHISPAINLALNLKTEFLFIGGNRLEKEMLKSFPFKEIATSRKNPIIILKGVFQAIKILRENKPKAVFASGGYVTVPVGIAAVLLRIPLVILEQNSIPGKTNLFLAKFAKIIFTGFPNANQYFDKNKTIFSSNPISVPDSIERREKNTILIMGGSQGARKLNQQIFESLPFLNIKDMEIIWLTGKNNFEEIKEMLKAYYIKDNQYRYKNVKIFLHAFYNNVPSLLKNIKFAISRSGAMSIAELTGFCIPSLYIPFPFAAENHQYYNALFMRDNKAGLLLEEKEASPEMIADRINKLENNYSDFFRALQDLNKQNAVAIIVQELKNKGYI